MNKSKGKKPKAKTSVKDAEKKKKEQKDAKIKEKERDYQRLEEYLNESGLSLAFNIIFAELISKQILPENYFTYTSMRLTQIGKEIEGLKTKEAIYVDDEKKEEQKIEEPNNEQMEEQPQNEENKELLFMTRPEQQKEQTSVKSKNVKKK